MLKELVKCQYCKQLTMRGYTCWGCENSIPWRDCCCENNGEYCEACQAWLEQRRAAVSREQADA